MRFVAFSRAFSTISALCGGRSNAKNSAFSRKYAFLTNMREISLLSRRFVCKNIVCFCVQTWVSHNAFVKKMRDICWPFSQRTIRRASIAAHLLTFGSYRSIRWSKQAACQLGKVRLLEASDQASIHRCQPGNVRFLEASAMEIRPWLPTG